MHFVPQTTKQHKCNKTNKTPIGVEIDCVLIKIKWVNCWGFREVVWCEPHIWDTKGRERLYGSTTQPSLLLA